MYSVLTEEQKETGRSMYILQACLEYLISILVSTSFLAALSTSIGLPDSLTGIISSVVSLGCLFQLGSFFLPQDRQKRPVIFLSLLNQALFLLLYVLPLIPGLHAIKPVIFTATIILAHFVFNLAGPKKTSWLMAMVYHSKRGVFRAKLTNFSQVIGIVYTLLMGAMMDVFRELGYETIAFILCGVVIISLSALHTIVLLIIPENPQPTPHRSPLKNIGSILSDRNVLKLIVLYILWFSAYYFATPFFGVYQIKELGFSLTLVSAITMISNIPQIFACRIMGRYADNHSFVASMKIGLGIVAVSFLINTFTVPANGIFFFTAYSIVFYIGNAGVGNALLNVIYDHVSVEQRSDATALCNALGGLAGFLSTLIASRLVTNIQAAGNRFMGFSLYAPQVLSALSVVLVLICLIYLQIAFRKKPEPMEN